MKKTLKRLTMAISLLVVLAVFTGPAFAACNTAQLVQRTDIKIQQRIDVSVNIADSIVLQQSSLAATLDGTVGAAAVDRALNGTVDRTIGRLIETTDRMAAQSVDLAAKNGDTIISEYIEVNIGGQTVLVDPIRAF